MPSPPEPVSPRRAPRGLARLLRREGPADKPAPPSRGAEAGAFQIFYEGRTHPICVKRAARARRLTLRVRAATRDVVLTMPPRCTLAQARRFAESQAAWIDARLACLPPPTPFGPGAIVPLRGVAHEIVHHPSTRGTVWVEPNGGAGGRPRLCVAGAAPFVARRVRDFLLRQARADLAVAVARHTARLGLPAGRMTLRDTATRWGSCSSSGALNFSWRLIMAPPFVLDYLAAHEVAHLRHMDHSPAFWTVTEHLAPQTAQAEAWLKANGPALMRLGGGPSDARR